MSHAGQGQADKTWATNFLETPQNRHSNSRFKAKMKYTTLLLVAVLAFAGLVRSSETPAAEKAAVSSWDEESTGTEEDVDMFDIY